MNTNLIQENDENLDELIVKARGDLKLKQIMLQRGNLIDFRLTGGCESAAELVNNVEEGIGFFDRGMYEGMLRTEPRSDYRPLVDTFLLCAAHAVLGSLDRALDLYERCLHFATRFIKEHAAHGLACSVLRESRKEELISRGYSFLDYLVRFRKQDSEVLKDLYVEEGKNHPDTLDNMMPAVAYNILGNVSESKNIYDAVIRVIKHSEEKIDKWKLVYSDTQFFKFDVASNSFVAIYEIMANKDTTLLRNIEDYWGYKTYDGRRFVAYKKKPKSVDNLAFALALMAERIFT